MNNGRGLHPYLLSNLDCSWIGKIERGERIQRKICEVELELIWVMGGFPPYLKYLRWWKWFQKKIQKSTLIK